MKTLLTFVLAATFATARATLPELPQPATSFGAAMADGWLYVYGGNTGKAHEFHRDCINGDFFRLRVPDGEAWEKLPAAEPLLGAAMATHDGWIYRIGGMEARNAKGGKNDLHSTALAVRFSTTAQKWETLPPLPEPRSSHDVTVLGDTLYVAGGWKLNGGDRDGSGAVWHTTLLTLDLRDPARGWQSLPQKFERRAIATVAHHGRLWFLGGMDSNDVPSRAVDWYDPEKNEWGHGPALPDGEMAGFGMAACSAGGKLLASPLSGKISALSADGTQWEPLTALATPRYFHRLLPTPDGRLVAVGGSNRKLGQVRQTELVSLDAPPAPASAETAPAVSLAPSKPVPPSTEPSASLSWPQWRGPQRDGISAETGWLKTWPAAGPRELWRRNVGVGMSSCVVAGGRLFTQGNDGQGTDSIVALDAMTGAELWHFAFPCKTAPHEMPIVPPGPGATPTVVGGQIFALSREGDLFAFDTASGQLSWRKNLVADLGGKRPVYGYSQSPLVEGGRIFLDVGAEKGVAGSTVALDAATGEVRWRTGIGEAGYSSARSFERDGRRLVAMFKGEALDVFEPADGRVLWSFVTTARDFTNAATPVFVGHRILVSNTSTDESAALIDWDAGDAPNPHAAWRHKQFALLFNTAIPFDGHLFAYNEKRRGHHEFTCVDAATGETKWVSDAVPTGTFILSDGHWIFLTREGDVVVALASTAGLNPSARFHALDGKSYATPTLAAGCLYVRNNTGDLAAFDLHAPATPDTGR